MTTAAEIADIARGAVAEVEAIDAEARARMLAPLAVLKNLPETVAPTFPVHAGVVFGEDHLRAIEGRSTPVTSAKADATALRTTRQILTSPTYSPWQPGSTLDPGEQPDMVTDSMAAVAQALEWRRTGLDLHRANVARIFDAYAGVKAVTASTNQKLATGWACENFTKAASTARILDHPINRFFTETAWPLLEHTQGPNWDATFADAMAGIAAVTGRTDLMDWTISAWDVLLGQSVYVRAFDGLTIRTKPKDQATLNHWGAQWGKPLASSSWLATGMADGTCAEESRDLTHWAWVVAGFAQAAWTIRLQGHALPPQGEARLVLGLERCAKAVLAYIDTGVLPLYKTTKVGDGGSAYLDGWPAALALFGPDRVPTVAAMLQRDRVRSRGFGAQHLVGQLTVFGAAS